mmetsp:Transcript_22215/g.30973  ORF Transcript_22215/g.30973 Transcript_22215/m.30973 type:complete len:226 (-) Transcript_22215:23-700(-)
MLFSFLHLRAASLNSLILTSSSFTCCLLFFSFGSVQVPPKLLNSLRRAGSFISSSSRTKSSSSSGTAAPWLSRAASSGSFSTSTPRPTSSDSNEGSCMSASVTSTSGSSSSFGREFKSMVIFAVGCACFALFVAPLAGCFLGALISFMIDSTSTSISASSIAASSSSKGSSNSEGSIPKAAKSSFFFFPGLDFADVFDDEVEVFLSFDPPKNFPNMSDNCEQMAL